MPRAEREEPRASRRALAALRAAPDKLEWLLRAATEKDGAMPLAGGAGTIHDLVARIGTLDRHHFLAAVKSLREGVTDSDVSEEAALAEGGDLTGCELAELVTRYRHVRAQSVACLDELPDELWRDRAFVRLLRRWIENDATALERLAETRSQS
jgi:hypothetical protein